MIIVNSIAELREQVVQLQQQGQPINFVPTMGNLHQGHISLVNEAKKRSGKTIASIFVNPMQFNDQNDLCKYPRTLDADIKKLQAAQCDLLFAPNAKEVYGAENLAGQTTVSVPELSETLEGASRPGHFDGVTTVVAKLFNLVQPQSAFFGEKDFQQLSLIRKMVQNLNFPIEVVSHPTIREADGLAMSSRNGYLSPEQRRVAPHLYQTLLRIKERIGMRLDSFVEIQRQETEWLNAKGMETDYLFIADANSLQQAEPNTEQMVILGAAYLGKTRLIDNIPLAKT